MTFIINYFYFFTIFKASQLVVFFFFTGYFGNGKSRELRTFYSEEMSPPGAMAATFAAKLTVNKVSE